MSVHNEELYQQVILEHNKRPKNYGPLTPCTHHAEGYNPLCGDHLNIYLRVSLKDIIDEVSFEGDGCAISKASASMMTAALKGKSVADARKLFDEFHHLLTKELDPEKEPHTLGKLTVFSGIWKYPSRVKCAVLAWRTMKGALDNQTTVASE